MVRLWQSSALAALSCLAVLPPAAAQDIDFAAQSSINARIDQMIAECEAIGRRSCVQVCESAKRIIAAEFAERQGQLRVIRFEFGPCVEAYTLAKSMRTGQ